METALLRDACAASPATTTTTPALSAIQDTTCSAIAVSPTVPMDTTRTTPPQLALPASITASSANSPTPASSASADTCSSTAAHAKTQDSSSLEHSATCQASPQTSPESWPSSTFRPVQARSLLEPSDPPTVPCSSANSCTCCKAPQVVMKKSITS